MASLDSIDLEFYFFAISVVLISGRSVCHERNHAGSYYSICSFINLFLICLEDPRHLFPSVQCGRLLAVFQLLQSEIDLKGA